MATRFLKTLILSLVLGALASCSSARKVGPTPPVPGTPSRGDVMGPPEPYGPDAPPPVPVYGPEPFAARPVVLVFGPGLARGFAYVGVLRALSEANIPVSAILGTEMGALIGSLYSMQGDINRFEWALLSFKEDVFTEKAAILPQLFDSKQRTGKRFDAALRKVFGRRDLSSAKIKTQISIQPLGGSSAILVDHGPAAQIVRAAMATPDLFPPGAWEGGEATSARDTRPFLVSEARLLNRGAVIAVNVLDESDAKAVVDLKDADLVIQPDMKGIGYLDFDKETEAAFRGKAAVVAQLHDIRRWAGLPEYPDKGIQQP